MLHHQRGELPSCRICDTQRASKDLLMSFATRGPEPIEAALTPGKLLSRARKVSTELDRVSDVPVWI